MAKSIDEEGDLYHKRAVEQIRGQRIASIPEIPSTIIPLRDEGHDGRSNIKSLLELLKLYDCPFFNSSNPPEFCHSLQEIHKRFAAFETVLRHGCTLESDDCFTFRGHDLLFVLATIEEPASAAIQRMNAGEQERSLVLFADIMLSNTPPESVEDMVEFIHRNYSPPIRQCLWTKLQDLRSDIQQQLYKILK